LCLLLSGFLIFRLFDSLAFRLVDLLTYRLYDFRILDFGTSASEFPSAVRPRNSCLSFEVSPGRLPKMSRATQQTSTTQLQPRKQKSMMGDRDKPSQPNYRLKIVSPTRVAFSIAAFFGTFRLQQLRQSKNTFESKRSHTKTKTSLCIF